MNHQPDTFKIIDRADSKFGFKVRKALHIHRNKSILNGNIYHLNYLYSYYLLFLLLPSYFSLIYL